MKLLLFGGTFDPPHIGHMSILKNAVAAVKPDGVFVVPAGIPPHKRQSDTPPEVRLAMCECFRPVFPSLIISDMEIARQGKSYTLDTVNRLLQSCPRADIYLCIGSDMLHSFTTWHRYDELLQKVTLVVQNRRQEDVTASREAAELLRRLGGRVLFASGDVEEISSSGLRAALSAGQNVWDKIPQPAAAIARREKLYIPAQKGLLS